jgi:hypothetical protein
LPARVGRRAKNQADRGSSRSAISAYSGLPGALRRRRRVPPASTYCPRWATRRQEAGAQNGRSAPSESGALAESQQSRSGWCCVRRSTGVMERRRRCWMRRNFTRCPGAHYAGASAGLSTGWEDSVPAQCQLYFLLAPPDGTRGSRPSPPLRSACTRGSASRGPAAARRPFRPCDPEGDLYCRPLIGAERPIGRSVRRPCVTIGRLRRRAPPGVDATHRATSRCAISDLRYRRRLRFSDGTVDDTSARSPSAHRSGAA